MVCADAETVKSRPSMAGGFAVLCASLSVTLVFAVAQGSNPRKSRSSQKNVTLIVHTTDERGNPIAPSSMKDIEVMEHGKRLQLVVGPRREAPTQIALLLDSNFNQRKVLSLEQQTATELIISAFEKENAQGFVTSYGAEIHSSGELTDDWQTLKAFVGSLQVETDKHNETILLYDAIKRALDRLARGPGTKAVVIFAEGNDHGSSIGWKSLAQQAQRAHVACYVVLVADHSFYGTKAVRHYGWGLVELAPKTGGSLREVGDNHRKAQETLQNLTNALRSQSLIEVLVPNTQDNRFHSVKVRTSGYRLSAQTGYFDDNHISP